MSSFALHSQLENDTFFLADWPLCRLLLMNNRLFPWLILVPRQPDLREIIDLGEADRQRLMEEISRACKALQGLYQPTKLNVAALGNMVPQLHLHVIARFETDAAWPQPVWGKGVEAYGEQEAANSIAKLRAALDA